MADKNERIPVSDDRPLPFSLKGSPEGFRGGAFNFLKKIRPEKNSEKFGILQSHNQLSARYLQKTLKVVFTKDAEIGKASAVAATAMA
jgi:hypothetical protein